MTAEDHISRFSRAFSAGHYDALLAHYDFPLPIYINRRAAVAHHAGEAWSFFHALHDLLRAHGFDGMAGRVISVELPQRGRFRLWVDWMGEAAGCPDRLLFKTVCYNTGSLAYHRTAMFTLEGRGLAKIESLLKAA